MSNKYARLAYGATVAVLGIATNGVFAQSADDAAKAQQRAAIIQQMQALQHQLDALDGAGTVPAPVPAQSGAQRKGGDAGADSAIPMLGEVTVTARKPLPYAVPEGQTATVVDRTQFSNGSAFTIGDVLSQSPGVTVLQGNGPRDVSISVRGSNERQTFGVRNVQVLEDGFPVTQPDGLARTDLVDPHAYDGIDVFQGPASALYGNYATGGMLNFRTRPGRSINGAEIGLDAGSFAYWNGYATVGGGNDRYEYTLFGSEVRGDGFTQHTGFNTDTLNFLGSYSPTASDKFTFKFVNNDLDTDLSLRLSLNQFYQNPYQQGCQALAGTACASTALFANAFNGARVNLSADQAGLGRHDRRTIAAGRWEHTLDGDAVWRAQLVFDNRDIKQPTGATSAVGTYPSFNLMTDLTASGSLFGLKATHFVGAFANYENLNAYTYNVAPGGNIGPGGLANLGGLTNTVYAHHLNFGLRGREELVLAPDWLGVLGVGIERTELEALSTTYTYPAAATPTLANLNVTRQYFNAAPEASLSWQATQDWLLRARAAGGYGTPQVTNLFVTPAGVAGNNTQLKPQKNIGVDLGADWTLDTQLKLSLIGFYEFFRDELVTQSPGPNLQNYTFNAPRSEHRGIELNADWRPLPGALVSLAYMLDDQRYTNYVERLSAGARFTDFDRLGNRIPGVDPQYVHLRLGYDQPDGPLQGAGAYVEADYRDAFYLDNGNLLKAPGYTLVNLDFHYNPGLQDYRLSSLRFFFEVRNLFDRSYVASASNLADTINAATGAQNPAATLAGTAGSIWAGAPRSFFGGVRVGF